MMLNTLSKPLMTSGDNFSVDKFKETIEGLNLDLTGFSVLTEAATGPYCVTPVIAAYCGAQVSMFAKDSSYGSATDAYNSVFTLAEKLNCKKNLRIFDPASSGNFDLITN